MDTRPDEIEGARLSLSFYLPIYLSIYTYLSIYQSSYTTEGLQLLLRVRVEGGWGEFFLSRGGSRVEEGRGEG